ncbi:ras-related protein Rab-13-like [Dysidea avara]|uniref:ras-related protein Rab-13-like n=1 Tax=Dysidea avara TaxID=196820 RepID=UPI00332B5B95
MSTLRTQLSVEHKCDHLFKVLICGDSAVGKTSILTRLVSNKFRVAHIRTLGVDFMMKYITVQGQRVQLKIWDTAGQEEFDAITSQFFKRAQGVLLAYDVTNSRSFHSGLPKWIKKLKENIPQFEDAKVPIVLIGNKIDLEDQRVISHSEGLKFAQQHDMAYYETSCATSINITEAVCGLVERIMEEVSATSQSMTESQLSPKEDAEKKHSIELSKSCSDCQCCKWKCRCPRNM